MRLAPPYRHGMPGPRRAAEGGQIYHALNRANARPGIFDNDDDYAAVERVLQQAVARFDMRLLAYFLMTTTSICCCGPATTATSPPSCAG